MNIAEAISKLALLAELTSTPEIMAERRETVTFRGKSVASGLGEVRVFHNQKGMRSEEHFRTRVWLEKNGIEDLKSKTVYSQVPGIVMFTRAAPSRISARPEGDIYE